MVDPMITADVKVFVFARFSFITTMHFRCSKYGLNTFVFNFFRIKARSRSRQFPLSTALFAAGPTSAKQPSILLPHGSSLLCQIMLSYGLCPGDIINIAAMRRNKARHFVTPQHTEYIIIIVVVLIKSNELTRMIEGVCATLTRRSCQNPQWMASLRCGVGRCI